MPKHKMIHSEYKEEMIPSGFTTTNIKGKTAHWTWCEMDLVYYRDDVDDCYYFDIPEYAVLDTI